MTLPASYARRTAMRALVIGSASALVLAGCGSTKSITSPVPKASLPTQSVSAPPGVTLTKAGTDLAFGSSANVGFEPNDKRSTALEITVRKVVRGSIADLRAYDLDAATKASRPYYARVTIKNIGTGEVGRSAIPLWGLASDNTLIGSTGFTNSFDRCPSGPLPAPFGNGASAGACLMYLVPKGSTLVGISYRPVMANAPIVWKGTISDPVAPKRAAKAKQAKKKAAR